MFNCFYRGQQICALDIYNEDNQMNFNLRREWKDAQQREELICENCGNLVDFRSGEIRTAYFAHQKGNIDRDCYYDRIYSRVQSSSL